MEKIKSMINSFTSFALKSVFAYAKNPSQAEMLGKYAETYLSNRFADVEN